MGSKHGFSGAIIFFSILGFAFAMPSWYNCDATNCAAPGCMCASNSAPGGLKPEDIPQFILITHDDAVNAFSNKAVTNVINRFTNPNGCNVPATWFTLQAGSDCNIVKSLWERNSEIALHTVNHKALVPNFSGGEQALKDEMFGVRDWLVNSCGIPKKDIVGFRSPYLVHNAETRSALSSEGMLYDSSMIQNFSPYSETETKPGERVWPFTMDAGIPIDCNWNFPNGRCNGTEERYKGLWEVPLWELQNAAADHLFTMDPEGDVFALYKENFDMNYKNNRAPFGIFLHSPWFTDRNTDALINFMNYAMKLPDVWAITTRQLIEWMKNPVPASQMGEWLKCNPVDLSMPLGDVRCQEYTVQPSDTSYSIATMFAVLTEEFLEVNPELGDGASMSAGEKVRIPPWDDGCVGDAVKEVTGPGQVIAEPEDAEISLPGDIQCLVHSVIVGETWDSIAKDYDVNVDDLKAANPDLPGGYEPSEGNALRIPPYDQAACPGFLNDPRPSLTGPSTDVEDLEAPNNGFRINMKLQGRTKIEFQSDLAEPFKSTVARALGIASNEIRIVNVTALNSAAGLRKLLQEEPIVEIEMTIPNPTPLTNFNNYTMDLSLDSPFNQDELEAFGLNLVQEPLIRVIKDGVTMDVATSETEMSPGVNESVNPSVADDGNNEDSGTNSDGDGLSTGAIIGIAVGGAAGLALISTVLIVIARKKLTKSPDDLTSESPMGSDQSISLKAAHIQGHSGDEDDKDLSDS